MILAPVLFATFATGYAQKSEINKGDKAYDKKEYDKALEKYQEAIKKGGSLSNNTKEKIANSYFYLNNYGPAKEFFNEIDLQDLSSDGAVNYGKLLQSGAEYDKAIKVFDKAGAKDPRVGLLRKSCEWAKANSSSAGNYATEAAPVDIAPTSFGATFMKNGIVYSGAKDKKAAETDLCYSSYSNGQFGPRTLFSKELVSEGNIGAASFSRDFTTMYFTRFKKDKNGTTAKIYEAKFDGKKWGQIKEMPFNNSKYSCAYPSLSADEKTLFFASDMPGSKGGYDIYVVYKQGSDWGKPVNLGTKINTIGDEIYPFISKKGELFFSSDGLPGYGGFDIFTSKEKDKQWSAPENMKRPINSPKNDLAFTGHAEDESLGMLQTNREGDGAKDQLLTWIFTNSPTNANDLDKLLESNDNNKSLDDFLQAASDTAKKIAKETNDAKSAQAGNAGTSDNNQQMTLSDQMRAMSSNMIVYRVQFKSSHKAEDQLKATNTGEFAYRYEYQGMYRYTIGEFYEKEPAIKLKEKMQQMGYKDAFVVAFKNGERVLDVIIYDRPQDQQQKEPSKE